MDRTPTEPALDIALDEGVRRALTADGIDSLTSVQKRTATAILAGDHVLLHAGTGTGKTLAYLLPVLQMLATDRIRRAVVVAPGAELAMQCHRVASTYAAEGVTTGAVIATSNRKRERKRINKSTRLIVGTPDRILPMFREGKLKGVELIVFDELEPVLAARGSDFFRELLKRSEPRYQLVVATATRGPRSESFISAFMADANAIQSDASPLHDQIRHLVVRGRDKTLVLTRFLQEYKCRRAMVFVSDTGQRSHLFHHLNDKGITTVTVSRDRTKPQRQRALEAFRAGRADVLLTTDASARGLDITGLPWVLHYDLPPGPDAYVHRAGRTGRANERGTSVLFVDDHDRTLLARLRDVLKLELEEE